jgi:hypothetical protein
MDPYLTLGVAKGSNREAVKEAFRVRVQHVHPDHGGEELSFIRLRTAYEQILAELDHDHGSSVANPERGPHVDGRPTPTGVEIPEGNYESWFRKVAAQADRGRSRWQSPRARRIGLAIVLGLIMVNLTAFLIAWRSEPDSIDNAPAAPTDGPDEENAIAPPVRLATRPAEERRWQKPPTFHQDFFIIPYNAVLYMAPVQGGRGDSTEFGIVASQGDFLPIFTGLPGRPNPAGEVLVGPVTRGSRLRVYLEKNNVWVFSDTASSDQTSESFWDRDNSLGGAGSIIEKTGDATWVLHLDDVGSTDDDDKDILIQIRLGPIEL